MDLKAFLHPAVVSEKKEIVISKRFLDDNGNPVPFKIQALTQEENDKIIKLCTKTLKINGQATERLDKIQYARRIIVAATVEPDFSQKEMCDAYGVLDPLEVPGRMLLSGEYQKLSEAIAELSGIGDGEDLGEEAKNS